MSETVGQEQVREAERVDVEQPRFYGAFLILRRGIDGAWWPNSHTSASNEGFLEEIRSSNEYKYKHFRFFRLPADDEPSGGLGWKQTMPPTMPEELLKRLPDIYEGLNRLHVVSSHRDGIDKNCQCCSCVVRRAMAELGMERLN